MEVLDRIVQESSDKQDIIENFRSHSSIDFLTAGNDRVVARSPSGNIIKASNQIRQNKTEIGIYENKDHLAQYVCPIIKYGDSSRWIIVREIKFDLSKRSKLSFLEKIVNSTGMFPRDMRLDDIGRIGDSNYISDYGFGFKSVGNDFSIDSEIN